MQLKCGKAYIETVTRKFAVIECNAIAGITGSSIEVLQPLQDDQKLRWSLKPKIMLVGAFVSIIFSDLKFLVILNFLHPIP
ncbi:hypothetical protein G7B40_006705 [Aetokthonos hydrillicola Thurmond2011]|jgi:hypothetical protein|uniref:Uncharacterized protein n=1 Tax=Aetokthonos hydrillicola Thurmond2011 TaxID=2712845 RepID=A0AAP5M3X3_9CYAN|nr:hypothetical protein [Aetokthonos hydrillicola]MBO3458534.1 hypothetical protein [Aetokthonos hydrillicola CCALA 1050]MBW4584978.1 hypothetical protein [Aetokthonos hydrillicola CCALA 1050]MDR9894261.1 hypothetical protein [Aetokthonos hydrillicola Thurmond2011]